MSSLSLRKNDLLSVTKQNRSLLREDNKIFRPKTKFTNIPGKSQRRQRTPSFQGHLKKHDQNSYEIIETKAA